MTSMVEQASSANSHEHRIRFTVRSADGETAKENASLDDTLQSVLDRFIQRTHFSIAANQVPYFEFEGRRYEDMSQPVRVIQGLEDDDTVALLIHPRSGA